MSRKIVIIEGPDCCGKTTLADEYIAEGYEYLHATYAPNMDVAQHHIDLISKTIHNPLTNYVIDRLYLSEYVYGTIFRDEWYGEHKMKVLKFLLGFTDKIICLPPIDVMEYEMNARIETEMYKDIDKMKQVYNMYQDILTDGIPDTGWTLYDWTQK